MDRYYVYILRCRDGSLYTGIAKDIKRRYEEHLSGKGAKYTRARGVEKLEIFFMCDGRSEASKVEYYIKKHDKNWKEKRIREFSLMEENIKKDLGIKIKKNIDTI